MEYMSYLEAVELAATPEIEADEPMMDQELGVRALYAKALS